MAEHELIRGCKFEVLPPTKTFLYWTVRKMQTETENIVAFKKSDSKKQIVFGEVYVPNVKDTDGNFMTAETIEKMAHNFLEDSKNSQISKSHDGNADKGCVVESFIAREGDPDFAVGSWVVGVHVPDTEIWKQIEKGELTGFSIEGTGTLIEEETKK